MNYLAHMQLSCSDDYLMVGNFLADMLNLHETNQLPQEYQKGVELHRLIDTFTDNHPAVSTVNKLLHTNHHKYAPVVSDVIFDYFLAKNWTRYESREIQSFCRMVYAALKSGLHLVSTSRAQLIERMIADNFLMKYTSLEGLAFVFDKMTRRSRYESNFPKALDDIRENHEVMDQQFNLFYPDLIAEINKFCAC